MATLVPSAREDPQERNEGVDNHADYKSISVSIAPSPLQADVSQPLGSADLANAILTAPMHVAGVPASRAVSHGVAQPGTPARDEALLVPSNTMSNEVCDSTRRLPTNGGNQVALEGIRTRDVGVFSEAAPPSGAYRSLQSQLREPEPRARGEDEEESDRLADLARPDDPRARVIGTRSSEAVELRPRLEQPLQVVAWGSAHNYQLGTGQYNSGKDPVLVESLGRLGGVVDIACGGDHCGAIDQEGNLYMWGIGDRGRLGNQGVKDAQLPAMVRALANERVAAVACGFASSACISENGELYTWGAGSSGQLGHGELADEWIPRMVAGLQRTAVVQVALGQEHTVALAADGCLFSWGRGDLGQLGHGDVEPLVMQPKRVNLADTVDTPREPPLAARRGADPPPTPEFNPTAVTSLEELLTQDNDIEGLGILESHFAVQAAAAAAAAAATAADAAAGTLERVAVGEAVLVCCGNTFTLVLTDRGSLVVFGTSEYGALGLGRTQSAVIPTRISSRILALRQFVNCAAGDDHCSAVTAKGGVYTWGQGTFGALGRPPANRSQHPPDCLRPYRLKLPGEARGRQVSCGANYTAIVCRDDSLLVIGADDWTIRPVYTIPTASDEDCTPLNAIEVVCGRFHTVALVDEDQAEHLRSPPGIFSRLIWNPLRALGSAILP